MSRLPRTATARLSFERLLLVCGCALLLALLPPRGGIDSETSWRVDVASQRRNGVLGGGRVAFAEASRVVLRIGAVYTDVDLELLEDSSFVDPWNNNTRSFYWDIELFQEKMDAVGGIPINRELPFAKPSSVREEEENARANVAADMPGRAEEEEGVRPPRHGGAAGENVFFEWVTVSDHGFDVERTVQVYEDMCDGVYGEIQVFFAGFGSTLSLVAAKTLHRCRERTGLDLILFVPTVGWIV
jgi:hypothetical protein